MSDLYALLPHLLRSRLSGLAVRVALALVTLADSDGIVRAGIRQIARAASPNSDIRRHVRRALRELEAAGLARCIAHGAPGKKDPALVALTWGSTPEEACGANGPTPQAGCGANGPTPQAGCGANGPTPQAGCGANGPTPQAGCGANGPTPDAISAPPSPHTPLPPEKPEAVPATESSPKILGGEKRREKGFPKESAASGANGQMPLPLQAPPPSGSSTTDLQGKRHLTGDSPPAGSRKTGLQEEKRSPTPARVARELREKWSGLDPNTALRAVKAAAAQGRGTLLVAEVIRGLETQECPEDPVARLVALCSHTLRLKVREQEEQVALQAIPEPLRGIVADFLRRHGLPVASLASEAAAMLREVPPHRMLVALGAAQGTGWEAWRQVREIARNGLRGSAGPSATPAEGRPDGSALAPQVFHVRQVFEQEYRERGMLAAWEPTRDDARVARLLQWLSEGSVGDPVDILRRALRKYLSLDDRAAAAGHPLSWFWARAEQYVNLVLKEDHQRRINQIPMTPDGKPMW